MSASHTAASTTLLSSSSETDGHGYVDHPYPSAGKPSFPEPPLSTMPTLPQPLMPNSPRQPKSDGTNKPATYNPDAYPKFPGKFVYYRDGVASFLSNLHYCRSFDEFFIVYK